MLKRAPMFLRVVCHILPGGKIGDWDALDQLEDTAGKDEVICVYRVVGTPGWAHINRGRNGSGFYAMANYKLCDQQPTDEVMRDNQSWTCWVNSIARKEGLLK